MEIDRIINSNNTDEIWKQVDEDLKANEFSYSAIINYDNNKIFLIIDVDPGGGFEGGYQTTTLRSQLNNTTNFNFAIHHQGLLDEIGKFFGMQDIETGYVEFDKKVVVKSNNEEKVKSIFSDASVRSVFTNLPDFTFHITKHHVDETENQANFLELNIEEAIVDIIQLSSLYNAFYSVLTLLNKDVDDTYVNKVV